MLLSSHYRIITKMKLYSPPIITAKTKITYGHGINLVFCDVFGRIDSMIGNSSELLMPAWNNQGLRAERGASSTVTISEDILKTESELEKELAYFGLSKYTPYRDTSESSRKLSQDSFSELLNRGFIVKNDRGYQLSIPAITSRTNLLNHLSSAQFWPKNAGIEAMVSDLIKRLDGSYPISKPRGFATPILGEEDSSCRINPIFDLSVSPLLLSDNSIDYSIDGSRTFLHGTFVPFLVWSSLKDKPFSKNIYVHGYAYLGNEIKNHTLTQLHNEFGSDAIRFALLTQAGRMEDKVHDRSLFKKGKLVRNKLVNLARYFNLRGTTFDVATLPKDDLKRYYKSNVSTLMDEVGSELLVLSSDLQKIDYVGSVERFKKLICLLSPVMPEAVNEIK